jgi:hypothetical protein
MVFVKTSILWFSFRLNRRRWMRWTVYFIIVFEIAQCFASLFGALFSYTPPSKFWDLEGTELGRCTRPILSRFYEVNGILNIVNDIRTWLLPIPMLWRVQMSQVRVFTWIGGGPSNPLTSHSVRRAPLSGFPLLVSCLLWVRMVDHCL